VAGDLEPDDLATFLEIEFPQIGRKAITSTKASRVPQPGRSAREARDPVVLRCLPPPIPPSRESLEPSALPRELSRLSSQGQADAKAPSSSYCVRRCGEPSNGAGLLERSGTARPCARPSTSSNRSTRLVAGAVEGRVLADPLGRRDRRRRRLDPTATAGSRNRAGGVVVRAVFVRTQPLRSRPPRSPPDRR
jgi:hypothetical protein